MCSTCISISLSSSSYAAPRLSGQCKCVGCPTAHEAAVATKVEALPCAVSSRGQPDAAVAVEKDSDMSVQEEVDRRNTTWWLERKAKEQSREQARLEQMRKDDMEVAAYWEARRDKEHADIMAHFNERAMEIVVAALGLRPGSTSAFATSAGSVVQPAPFCKVAPPHAHADADVHAHADADVRGVSESAVSGGLQASAYLPTCPSDFVL